jgi:membrane-bound ClpP family serine protease
MFWFIVFGIIILGLLFVLAEILFVPGGLLGILGILVILFGIYFGYSNGGSTYGHIVLASTLVFTLGAIVLAVRSKSWKKIALNTNLDQKYNINIDVKVEKGDAGVSITRLNPMGKALINNIEAEVISLDGFLNESSELIVHNIEGSKIYVKQKS